jgi:hypothetical protein
MAELRQLEEPLIESESKMWGDDRLWLKAENEIVFLLLWQNR